MPSFLSLSQNRKNPRKKRTDRSILLPVANFRESVRMLSPSDAELQFRTVQTILSFFRRAHLKVPPRIAMWINHETALKYYEKLLSERTKHPFFETPINGNLPPWFGNPEIHASHRAVLLKRNPEHYQQFGWKEKKSLLLKFPKLTTMEIEPTLVELED